MTAIAHRLFPRETARKAKTATDLVFMFALGCISGVIGLVMMATGF